MSWGSSPVRGHWCIEATDGTALVTAVPPDRPAPAHLWQPRVCSKVGVGIPLARLSSLVAAISATVEDGQGGNSWSKPGIDRTEGFAYVQGPVGALDDAAGWQPMDRFTVASHDLFHLGRQLSVLVGRV